MTVLDLAPVSPDRAKADLDENHLYCCNPDVSLCGLDLTGHNERDFADEECCPLCADLEDLPCGPGCQNRTPGAAS